MSNSLDPDQAQDLVGPNLGPNCYQRLSADDFKYQAKIQITITHDASVGNNTRIAW